MNQELYKPIPRKEAITVAFLIQELQEKIQLPLQACGGDNMSQKKVTEAELHRPGLALAGFTDLFTWQRIQIMGNTEIHYLSQLSKADSRQAIEHLCSYDIPVIFVTSGNEIPEVLTQTA